MGSHQKTDILQCMTAVYLFLYIGTCKFTFFAVYYLPSQIPLTRSFSASLIPNETRSCIVK